MTGTGVHLPIDDAVATLAARLSGPRRARADLVAEVRDGLYDTAEAYRELGLPDRDAERRSLADFGDLGQVADELQTELTARYARRTAWTMLLTFPGMVLLWDGLWAIRAADGATSGIGSASSASDVLSSVVDVVALLSGLAALGGLLALRRDGRRPDDRPRRLAAVVGRACLAGVALTLAAALPMALQDPSGPTGPTGVLGVPAEVALWATSLLIAGWLLLSSSRCVRLARRSSPTSPDT